MAIPYCLLPSLQVHAVVRMQAGPIFAKPMQMDTLVFDLKAMTLSCVYRLTLSADTGVRVLEIRNGRGAE